ncbi:MAG: homoserine kinase [Eubacteriales bacterium]|nr:homoserine kinase [Eubacteriales bacterium]
MVRVRVPATSANMGAGFDSLGIALSLYNTITVEEISSGLVVENQRIGEYIPTGENNLIYRAIKTVFEKVGYKSKGLRIVQNSDIPMTRGLGSSSACIIGGMLAANVISGRQLSYNDILDIATKMEGHPDNVAPALYGGFCTSVMSGSHTVTKSVKIEKPISFMAMVPDFFVLTRKSRVSLPETVTHKDAAYNAGHAALFSLAMATGDFEKLKIAVKDKLHQPYRAAYIDNMEQTFDEAYKNGAYAVWLSGSGPTILAMCSAQNEDFEYNMSRYFESIGQKSSCRRLTIDNVGAIVQVI